jgi:hypothetical protein
MAARLTRGDRRERGNLKPQLLAGALFRAARLPSIKP